MLVLRDAFQGVTRFEMFGRRLKVAPNILAKRLTTLVEAGVLERRRYQERPERFEYVLTPAGKELLPALVDLMRWGDAHLAPNGPPAISAASRRRQRCRPPAGRHGACRPRKPPGCRRAASGKPQRATARFSKNG